MAVLRVRLWQLQWLMWVLWRRHAECAAGIDGLGAAVDMADPSAQTAGGSGSWKEFKLS